MSCQQLNDIIKSSKNILIMSHLNPDGDTLGSLSAMYSAIWDNFRKKADMLVMSGIPYNLKFLPNLDKAKCVSEFDKSREYDLVINVDIAAYNRMLDSEILFDKAKFTVNIDHHITNDKYADLNFVAPEASSTGEVLYEIMDSLGWKISVDTAKGLYTAILTDTGSFTFNNTSYKALQYAANLVNIGVKPHEIYKSCYESYKKERIQFQTYCLNKAVFCEDDKVAYIVIYKKDMEKFNVADDCTEGLAERLRAVESVKVSFIVKQLASSLSKVSMRSDVADVSAVCAKFGGGGHKLAAGCTIKSGVKEAAKKVLEEVSAIKL